MSIDRLRGEPLAHLPALIALALASFSLPARANARMITLCSGSNVPLAPVPGRRSDGDSACHAGCIRQKRPGASRGL